MVKCEDCGCEGAKDYGGYRVRGTTGYYYIRRYYLCEPCWQKPDAWQRAQAREAARQQQEAQQRQQQEAALRRQQEKEAAERQRQEATFGQIFKALAIVMKEANISLLQKALDSAKAWCVQQGAMELHEVFQEWANFSKSISATVKPFEMKRLHKVVSGLVGAGRCTSAQVAQALAEFDGDGRVPAVSAKALLDETRKALSAVMRGAKISDLKNVLRKAESWCQAQGALELDEIFEEWASFSGSLSLKPYDKTRLQKVHGDLVGACSGGRSPAQSAQALAQAAGGGSVPEDPYEATLDKSCKALAALLREGKICDVPKVLESAKSHCRQHGAAEIEEVFQVWAKFSQGGDLKPLEKKRLQKVHSNLLRPGSGRTSLAEAAQALAESAGAGDVQKDPYDALAALLEQSQMSDLPKALQDAKSYCTARGAAELQEILEELDNFSTSLKLKPLEKQRLQKVVSDLGRAISPSQVTQDTAVGGKGQTKSEQTSAPKAGAIPQHICGGPGYGLGAIGALGGQNMDPMSATGGKGLKGAKGGMGAMSAKGKGSEGVQQPATPGPATSPVIQTTRAPSPDAVQAMRLSDLDGTFGDSLKQGARAIVGIGKLPLVDTLEEAVKAFMDRVEYLDNYVEEANQNAEDYMGRRSAVMAALYLYTIECDFYKELNKIMRSRAGRERYMASFGPYLRLLLEAKNTLPPLMGRVFRGIKDLPATGSFSYEDQKQFFESKKGGRVNFWGFTSCSKDHEQSMAFLDLNRATDRIFFVIEAKTAIELPLSANPQETEVLLFPGSTFSVRDVLPLPVTHGQGIQVLLEEDEAASRKMFC